MEKQAEYIRSLPGAEEVEPGYWFAPRYLVAEDAMANDQRNALLLMPDNTAISYWISSGTLQTLRDEARYYIQQRKVDSGTG